MDEICSYTNYYLGSLLYTTFRIFKKSTRVPNDQKTREGISARNRPTDDLRRE